MSFSRRRQQQIAEMSIAAILSPFSVENGVSSIFAVI